MKRGAGVFLFFLTGLCGVSGGVASADAAGEDLAKQVEIRRTAYGVPHILADTEVAAGFGMGYVQAEDHLLNIMRSILRARGEQAKYFGGRSNIEADFRNRQFRVYARAVETYHLLDEDWRDMMEGYAAGLNYYIELHRASLPEWVVPITGHDVAAHGMTGVMRFAFNRGNIIRRFLGKVNKDEPFVADAEPMGSNAWAFGPSRTKSGNAILMGNPHQAWAPVSTYYEAHLTIPGKVNFYGSTFVGRPVMTTGFNENLGWTHTVNYPDLEEIYELDLDPARPGHYLFDGGSVPMRSETQTVEIKTDTGMEVESRTFWHTPLGPVIHRTDTMVYVLKSVVYDEYRFYQQWWRMGQAKNFEEWSAIMRETMAIPMFNTVYADRDKNIYYLWNGTVPDIPHAAQRDMAVHARRSSEIWTRIHPLSELPQLLNPKGGYVFNSNSPPYFTNLYQPLDRGDFPDHFPDNRLSLRSQHSLHLQHNRDKFSLEDVVDMKYSMRALLADRVKADLVDAATAADPGDDMKVAIRLLEQWDNTVAKDSRGSVLFDTWRAEYTRGKQAEDIYAVQWSESDPIETPRGLADPGRAVSALAKAIDVVRERYGAIDVAWGYVHRLRFGDEVDIPLGGGSGQLGCFRIVGYREAEDGKLVARTGDSWVFAVEFADTPKAYTIIAYSESEVEGTPHFADQAELFANRKMKRAAFTEKEIKKQLIASYHPGEER